MYRVVALWTSLRARFEGGDSFFANGTPDFAIFFRTREVRASRVFLPRHENARIEAVMIAAGIMTTRLSAT